jgi:hypothetical protein
MMLPECEPLLITPHAPKYKGKQKEQTEGLGSTWATSKCCPCTTHAAMQAATLCTKQHTHPRKNEGVWQA